MNQTPNDILFRETQRFRRVSFWVLAAVTVLGIAAIAIYLVIGYLQPFIGYVDELPEMREHVPGAMPIWVACLLFVAIMGAGWLMYAAHLETEVRPSGLFVQFFPFHLSFRRIDLQNLAKVEATEYRPIRDYGGWGIRYGPAGKAYNVSGNRGVKLTFRSGTDLLIGSQRPEELAEAIKTIK